MNIRARLAQRRWTERPNVDYWQQVLELEQGRRLALHELNELADICLGMLWDEMEDQWAYDEIEDLMNEWGKAN